MGTKKGRIYVKGAPFKGAPQRFGGGSCPKLSPPLDPQLLAAYIHFLTPFRAAYNQGRLTNS